MTDAAGDRVSGNASSCLAGSRKPREALREVAHTVAFWPVLPSLTSWSTHATVARRSDPSATARCSAPVTFAEVLDRAEALGGAVPQPRLDLAVRVPRDEHVTGRVHRDRDRADAGLLGPGDALGRGRRVRAELADEVDVAAAALEGRERRRPCRRAGRPRRPRARRRCPARAASSSRSRDGPVAMPTFTRRPDGPTYMIRSPAAQALKLVSKSGAPAQVVAGCGPPAPSSAAQRPARPGSSRRR